MSGYLKRHKMRRVKLLAVLLFAAVSAICIWVTALTSYRFFERDLETRLSAVLQVQAGVLESHLEKFRVLAPLVARSPDTEAVSLFRDEQVGKRVSAIAAGMAGAGEVWFLSASGDAIASSLPDEQAWAGRGREGISVAFDEAAQGQLGRQLVLGTHEASNYVFAAPIRVENRLSGILAVRVPLDPVEQAWALTKFPIFASDYTGRIAVTNMPDTRARPVADFDGSKLLRIDRHLPVLDWTVHAYADPVEVRRQSLRAVVIVVLICVILGGILWGMIKRWEDQVHRRRRQKAEALRLERKVHHRTAELRQANIKLTQEVQERLKAEDELKRAQAELVQAAKLATLGEMSASLSHEYNQPLAAIRSDADVAEMLIARGRSDEAVSNLQRIGAMVDRMAEIARTLKGFTRKAGTDVKPVDMHLVVDEAVLLLRPQLKRTGTDLVTRLPEEPLRVSGGEVRLQQVVVNLLSNAVDSASEHVSPKVVLCVERQGPEAVLTVEDNGSGIDDLLKEQIFQPFFTTKQSGSGLGLGLSIAYKIVHDFKGTLTVEDGADGGARFVMRLPLADSEALAAE